MDFPLRAAFHVKWGDEVKGIVIWGWSRCRSVMGMMRELAGMVPVKFALWHDGVGGYRIEQGHRADEFDDVPAVVVGDDWNLAKSLFDETKGWIHLVSPYQRSPLARQIAIEAHARGDVVGVICEAPWNGHRYGAFDDLGTGTRWVRHVAEACNDFAWNIYLRTFLKWRVRGVVEAADFFVMYSGDDMRTACAVGWPRHKLVGYGYFPPPLEGTSTVRRNLSSLADRACKVLATGTAGREHRGALVLERARDIFSQRYPDVKVKFVVPGFVDVVELKRLYETCDVFVGAGENEPWGMRLNDALNCGVPLLVSDGMGGRKIVERTGAGLVFRRMDASDLADKLHLLISDYGRYADAAYAAREAFSCRTGAEEMLRIVKAHMKGR